MAKKLMKLWLLVRTDSWGYDDFNACVVVASTEEEARLIQPANYGWCAVENVSVKYLGKTDQVFDSPVICASFNAG